MLHKSFGTFVALAMVAGAINAQALRSSTAYIDMEKVFEGFYKTRRAEASLRRQEDVYKERAETLIAELEALKKNFDQLHKEAQSVALSETAQARKREEAHVVELQLRDRDRDLQKYMADKKREMQRDYVNSRNAIVKEILVHVRKYADDNGYQLVLDVSGMTQNMLPVVLKYPEDREITTIVLQELNRGYEDEAVEDGDEPDDDDAEG